MPFAFFIRSPSLVNTCFVLSRWNFVDCWLFFVWREIQSGKILHSTLSFLYVLEPVGQVVDICESSVNHICGLFKDCFWFSLLYFNFFIQFKYRSLGYPVVFQYGIAYLLICSGRLGIPNRILRISRGIVPLFFFTWFNCQVIAVNFLITCSTVL